MHISIILLAVSLAIISRLCWFKSSQTWAERWQQTLGAFILPPLLFLMTSLTVLLMGHHGTMLWLPVGWIGCHLALGLIIFAGGLISYQFWQGWRSLQQVYTYPLTIIAGQTGRVLDTSILFAAQIGFWQPELVISQGLIESLEPEQVKAIISHEQAHAQYRDTFWFFWLGCLRQLTFWLPKTEPLWQELLLLRELRADNWAAQQVDALVLAESLLLVVRSPLDNFKLHCAAFNDINSLTRLEERIDTLITQPDFNYETKWWSWAWLLLSLLPMLTLPLHI